MSRYYLTSRDPRHQRLPLHFGHGGCCPGGDYLNYSDGVGDVPRPRGGHQVPRPRGDARVDEQL